MMIVGNRSIGMELTAWPACPFLTSIFLLAREQLVFNFHELPPRRLNYI